MNTLSLTKVHALFRFPPFAPAVPLYSGVLSGTPHYILWSYLLGLHKLPRLSLFSMNLIVFRSTGQIFCRILSVRICMVFSPWLDSGGGLLKGRPQRQGAILIPYQKYTLSTWFIIIDIDFDHLAKFLFADFPAVKLPPLPNTVLFEMQSLCAAHT